MQNGDVLLIAEWRERRALLGACIGQEGQSLVAVTGEDDIVVGFASPRVIAHADMAFAAPDFDNGTTGADLRRERSRQTLDIIPCPALDGVPLMLAARAQKLVVGHEAD